MNRFRRHGLALCFALTVSALTSAGTDGLEAEARQLLEASQPAEAVRIIEKRSSDTERSAQLWFLLAQGYRLQMDEARVFGQRGLTRKMKRALLAAIEVDPEHVNARRALIDFYYDAPYVAGGDRDEAARQLDLLARTAPAETLAIRGDRARRAGDLASASAQLREARELGVRDPERTFNLAVVEQQLGRFEKSIELLDEVIAAEPGREKAYYYYARASAATGVAVDRGLECAVHYLEHCTGCNDADRSYGWWRRGMLHEARGQLEEAAGAYREALRLNPDLDEARDALAELAPNLP